MIGKISQLFKSMGLLGGCLYAIARLLQSISPDLNLVYYRIVVQPVAPQPLLPARRGKQFNFQLLTEPAPLLAALPRPSEVIKSRFAQGSICIAALLEDELVGCIWLQQEQYQEDEIRCTFALANTQLAWDYDVYIDDKHRMGFLFAKLWDQANEYLRNRHITHTASRISAFNLASLASHSRLGAEPVTSAVYLVLGTRQITFSPDYPWLQYTGRHAQPPRVTVTSPAT